MSGSEELVAKNEGVYKDLRAVAISSDAIAADVQRTFPEHPFFRDSEGAGYSFMEDNKRCGTCWKPLLIFGEIWVKTRNEFHRRSIVVAFG